MTISTSEQDLLRLYANTVLNTEPFLPDAESVEEQVFAASLSSTRELLRDVGDLQNAEGEPLVIYPGFAESVRPNAIADQCKAGHFMIMNQSLLVTIQEFALFAFTQRELFPQIGEASAETSPALRDGQVPGLHLLQVTTQQAAVSRERDSWRVPIDGHRQIGATYLALLMARFVWLHEFAHCRRGHLGMVVSQGLAQRLYEVTEPKSAATLKLREIAREHTTMLHEMEHEADEDALVLGLRGQMEGMEPVNGIAALDAQTRMEMVLFGAYAMTWLFDQYEKFARSRQGTTHPLPIDRLSRLLGATEKVAGQASVPISDARKRVSVYFNELAKVMPGMGDFAQASGVSDDVTRAKLKAMCARHAFNAVSR